MRHLLSTGWLLIRLFQCVMVCSIAVNAWANGKSPERSVLVWQAWSPIVFEQVRRTGQLVLLDVTAKWCQFCRMMDETTYRDPQVIDVINRHYLPVRADEEVYPEVAKWYYGRPVTVILDGNGTEIIKHRGYLKPQWMIWLLDAVAENPSPEAHR